MPARPLESFDEVLGQVANANLGVPIMKSQELRNVTVPTVHAQVLAGGESLGGQVQVIYVPRLDDRKEPSHVAGILESLVHHGFPTSLLVNGTSYEDMSGEDRNAVYWALVRYRQSVNGSLADVLKKVIPGFKDSSRYKAARSIHWHGHDSVGESVVEALFRPSGTSESPVKATGLGLPGDVCEVMSIESSGTPVMEPCPIGGRQTIPFGKVFVRDDVIKSARERTQSLSEKMGPEVRFVFKMEAAVEESDQVDQVAIPDQSEEEDGTEVSFELAAVPREEAASPGPASGGHDEATDALMAQMVSMQDRLAAIMRQVAALQSRSSGSRRR